MKATAGAFTLIELVIALGIIMLVSGGVFLSLRNTSHRALQNASLELQADLRYAQRRAIMEGRRFGVQFEPTQNRYHIIEQNGRFFHVIRTVYFENGVRLRHTTGNRLVFLPRGTSSGGFSINLSNGRYWQRLTATVSGGRIQIHDITTEIPPTNIPTEIGIAKENTYAGIGFEKLHGRYS